MKQQIIQARLIRIQWQALLNLYHHRNHCPQNHSWRQQLHPWQRKTTLWRLRFLNCLFRCLTWFLPLITTMITGTVRTLIPRLLLLQTLHHTSLHHLHYRIHQQSQINQLSLLDSSLTTLRKILTNSRALTLNLRLRLSLFRPVT